MLIKLCYDVWFGVGFDFGPSLLFLAILKTKQKKNNNRQTNQQTNKKKQKNRKMYRSAKIP